MQFIRQDVVTEAEAAQVGQFDIAFIGQENLDDRSRYSAKLSRAVSRRHCSVRYDSDAYTLHVDGKAFKADGLEAIAREFRANSILLDATTLEFPEILYLLWAYRLHVRNPRCGFFYVEPEGYAEKVGAQGVIRGSAFDLSAGFKPRKPLPLVSRLLSDTNRAHLVAFLGFEGDRLSRVLNEDDRHFYPQVTVVFGVPPFQPSWDLHSLMAHTNLLEQPNTHVTYCGANSPRAAYMVLRDVHAGHLSGNTNRLAVAPFGTKPMALGAALYRLDHEILSPMYDHPVRKPNRTYGVSKRHWYEVSL